MSSESFEALDSFNIVVNQPTLSDDGPKSKKPWKYLSKFEVTCQGYSNVRCPVYANGRQQIPIQVNVEARDEDGVIVDVNHGRLYLNLCLYDEVDVFPPELGRSGTEDSRFVYNHNVVNASSTTEESAVVPLPHESNERWQVVKQFVSANKVGTYKLAVRCRSPDWVLFVTNTPNPPDGKFDSWLLIEAREPKSIHWEQLGISERNHAVVNVNWDVDLYYIYFKDPNYRIVDSINYRTTIKGAHYVRSSNRITKSEHIAFPVSEPRVYTHTSCGDSSISVKFNINNRPGQATAARVHDFKAGLDCGHDRRKHGLMGYIDQYGNESKVTLKAFDYGQWMTLDDPSLADQVPVDSEPESPSEFEK